PYRGTNHRYLEGWHFRNQANAGPNQGDVNAPQRERGFAFVLTPADYRRAAAAVDLLLWGKHPQAEREQALTTLEQTSRGRGTLRITDMTLGNLVPGVQAWFETLDFDAELCRPVVTRGGGVGRMRGRPSVGNLYGSNARKKPCRRSARIITRLPAGMPPAAVAGRAGFCKQETRS